MATIAVESRSVRDGTGTPPTMIAYSARLYTAGQIFRTGIVLGVVGIVLLVFVVTKIWELFGLV